MAAEAATNRENFRGPQRKARYLLLLEGEENVTEVFYVSWDVTTKPLQRSMNLCLVRFFFFQIIVVCIQGPYDAGLKIIIWTSLHLICLIRIYIVKYQQILLLALGSH